MVSTRTNAHITKLLNEFSKLGENWDGEDSAAPSRKVLMAAFKLVDQLNLRNCPAYHAAPGPAGEVMISFRAYSQPREMEILFYPDKMTYVKFPVDGTPEQGGFEWGKLEALLKWLNSNA